MADNSDIILCAEFKQILGPSIIFSIPEKPCVSSKSIKESEQILNSLLLKAMSMKFTSEDAGK